MNEDQWLAEFPTDWTELRADFLCDPYRITVSPEQFGGSMVAHYSIPQVQETGGPLVEPADDIDSTKLLITEPTLLVSKLNPRKRTICIALPRDDIATLASGEFVPIRSEKFLQRYAYYVWLSEKVTDRLSAIVQSATRSHQRVNPADILKLPWKWPPLDTQKRIAAFLDEKTARIDALIEKKQALLERLAEKRQAIITQAVTKGLNPAAPMKPSGIDWLGEIPAHWEVVALNKLTSKITNGYVGPTRDLFVDDGIRYIQSLHIKSNRIIFGNDFFVEREWSEQHAKSIIKVGDVLIVQTGDIGQVACVTPEHEGCNCHALIICTPIERLSGPYLSWLLNSDYGQKFLHLVKTGALHPHLNCGNVKFFNVLVPPIEEQGQIVDFVDRQTKRIADMQSLVTGSHQQLTEYRAALITAAVTGQIVGLQ